MSRAEKAREVLAGHSVNCAQAVLTSFCEELGMEKEMALRLAGGFGGGMEQSGGTCGAVTGAYMVLGLALKVPPEKRHGRNDLSDAMVEFKRRFKELHGSLSCTELSGYDLSRPEQALEAFKSNVFTDVCPVLVRDSVKILEDLLKKKGVI